MPRQLDLKALAIGMAALAMVTFDQSDADHPGAHARKAADGGIAIEAVYIAPETCWSVDKTAPGAPAGVELPAGSLGAVVTLKRFGDLCGQALTPVKAAFSVPDRPAAKMAMIYFVNAEGKLLKVERTAIRR